MGFKIVEDNTDEIISLKDLACMRALRIIGGKAKDYATELCPAGTPETTGKKGYQGGTLRQSITFESDDESMTLGTNVEYAPYVELGTGPNFTPPPEWEEFDVPKPKGIGHGYVEARPFIRPAISDHLDEYQQIIENELGNA
jgi:HK97 gp10 family phage protein